VCKMEGAAVPISVNDMHAGMLSYSHTWHMDNKYSHTWQMDTLVSLHQVALLKQARTWQRAQKSTAQQKSYAPLAQRGCVLLTFLSHSDTTAVLKTDS
jgi:hypothetical protein